MSICSLTWAVARTGMTPRDKLVLVILANRANERRECWPSMGSLIDDTGLSERSIQDAVKALARAGVLTIEVGGGRGRTNLYRLQTPQNMTNTPQKPVGIETNETPQNPQETPQDLQETPQTSRETPQHLHPEPKEPKGTQREPKVLRVEADADFAIWYAAYPRKVGRDNAAKAYTRARKRMAVADLLLAVRTFPFDHSRPEFIPHPATWLNQGRWADTLEHVRPVSRAGPARQTAASGWAERYGLVANFPAANTEFDLEGVAE